MSASGRAQHGSTKEHGFENIGDPLYSLTKPSWALGYQNESLYHESHQLMHTDPRVHRCLGRARVPSPQAVPGSVFCGAHA